MAEQTLPAVAKTIHLECKKCGVERYHIVVAHTSATSAKVECEVCHSKKTYKLPTAKKAKTVSGAPKVTRTARSASARAEAHKSEYETMLAGPGDMTSYNMKTKFALNQKIQHPKFGVGVVKSALPDKVEVIFLDEVRSLVHNRG